VSIFAGKDIERVELVDVAGEGWRGVIPVAV